MTHRALSIVSHKHHGAGLEYLQEQGTHSSFSVPSDKGLAGLVPWSLQEFSEQGNLPLVRA